MAKLFRVELTDGIHFIAEGLMRNPPLESICFSRNHLENDGIIKLARSLKYNTNLKRLKLHGKNMTETGKKLFKMCSSQTQV